MKNVLITGATGFIGKNLMEGLATRYNLFGPSHNELDVLDYDKLTEYVKRHKIDFIIHAAIHVPMFNGNEKEFFNDMQMFLNIEKISSLVEKVIYFGSGAEFDKRFHIRNVTEDDFGNSIPTSEYGLAKYTMNKIARKSKNIYNIRLFGIFGKYELWQIKFISNICCKAIYDLPLTIRKDCYFNFVYIEDLASVIVWLLEDYSPKKQCEESVHNRHDENNEHCHNYHDFNFCHDKNYKLTELAKMVRDISGKDLEIKLLSDDLNLDYTANNYRLHEEMPDLKITSIEQAIKELYLYYSENSSVIDFEILRKTK